MTTNSHNENIATASGSGDRRSPTEYKQNSSPLTHSPPTTPCYSFRRSSFCFDSVYHAKPQADRFLKLLLYFCQIATGLLKAKRRKWNDNKQEILERFDKKREEKSIEGRMEERQTEKMVVDWVDRSSYNVGIR